MTTTTRQPVIALSPRLAPRGQRATPFRAVATNTTPPQEVMCCGTLMRTRRGFMCQRCRALVLPAAEAEAFAVLL